MSWGRQIDFLYNQYKTLYVANPCRWSDTWSRSHTLTLQHSSQLQKRGSRASKNSDRGQNTEPSEKYSQKLDVLEDELKNLEGRPNAEKLAQEILTKLDLMEIPKVLSKETRDREVSLRARLRDTVKTGEVPVPNRPRSHMPSQSMGSTTSFGSTGGLVANAATSAPSTGLYRRAPSEESTRVVTTRGFV